MAGINLAGTPNTGDYQLGRGIVYFATLNASGFPEVYRDLGNAPSFNVNVATTLLDHKSSRSGLKVIDKEIVVEQVVTLTLELDEINFDNLAEFLSGADTTFANGGSIAGVVPDALGNLYVITQGRWYDLYDTVKGIAGITADPESHRIYDITLTSVKSLDGMTTYSGAGVDYTIDLVWGRIFIVKGGAMTGAASPGTGYKVAIAAHAGAKVPDEVKALTRTTVSGAIKFIAANPANADQGYEYQFHSVLLAADGDFALISDQIGTMKFKGTAQRNEAADADSPYVTIRTHSAAHS